MPSQTLHPEKFNLCSMSLTDTRRAALLKLFPEVVTEDGMVDYARLQLALGEAVDTGRERYGMTWPGLSDCFKTIQTPSMATLRPARAESVRFDTSDNVIIEGDNLEVLKLLQKSYLGKVKMIYIDPPYNTGNDFIYPDNYTETLQTYLEYTGQVDSEGKKFGTNTDSEGRFHSRWLNMMYPRLFLGRNLLRQDGVMFISIGEEELDNLLKLCHMIFGEENYCGLFVWEKKKKPSFLDANMGSVTDYIVCVARDRSQAPPFAAGAVEDGKKYPFNNAGNSVQTLTFPAQSVQFRCPDQTIPAQDMSEGNIVTELLDPVSIVDGTNAAPFRLRGEWRYSQQKLNEFVEAKAEIVISKVPFRPNYINRSGDLKKTANLLSHRTNGVPTNEDATEEIRGLFGADVMSHPKPSGLVQYLVRAVTVDGDLVMDFFAGSGTTAHGVWLQDAVDGGERKWILVQLPERLDPADPASKAAAEFCREHKLPLTLSEITKERVRRVIDKLDAERTGTLVAERIGERDYGFRVFRLDQSNFQAWDTARPDDGAALEQRMFAHVEHVREGRAEADLLYEILLKSGFPLTTPVETLTLADKKVYSVAEGALVLCLERHLTMEVIRAIADKRPERVVCLDAGFAGNDQLKTNAVQIFKTKGVGSFKTV